MKSLKSLIVVFAALVSTASTSSLVLAENNHEQVKLATSKSKTVIKVKKITGKKVVKKAVKKYPLILVFGTDRCGRTTYMRKQLTSNKIAYKYRNLDDPMVNKQMWDLLRRYELKSNSVSLPVVYVKGNVFLNPGLEDVKSKV